MARRSWGKVRKLPSGHFQASYVGPDAIRHTADRTFVASVYAESWLADERRLLDLRIWTPPSQRTNAKMAVTVYAYAERWIDERNLKPRTKIGYKANLEGHIKPRLGSVPLHSLTPEAVRAWFAGLGTTYRKRNAHVYGLLHAICATAVTDGVLAANPCSITGVMNPPTKKQPVILNPAEVAALADAIEPHRLRALILVLAWCGPRWGEAIELRRRDLNDDCSVLTIARGATHRQGCVVDTPKTGKGRKVVVPPHIRTDLTQHLNGYIADDADALLFLPARGGCHLNDKVFRDSFRDALAEIKFKAPFPTIHDLRHTAGTMAAQVGNLRETMDRLGHTTAKASLIYQQIAEGRDVAVAEGLSKLAIGGA